MASVRRVVLVALLGFVEYRGVADGLAVVAGSSRRCSRLGATAGVAEERTKGGVFDKQQKFNLTAALFCGGLAFDCYTEPPKGSSRWERGSSGLNVAFQSVAYTRSLYKGLVEVTLLRCTDLPDEDDAYEGILSGGGIDACVLVAVAEGKWKEDIRAIEDEKFNDGVLALKGCAHVGRSSTAWSNAREGSAYHVKSSWGKGGESVWESEPPFYLYVQHPPEARLVFTVMDDDVMGPGSPIGSTSKKLADLIPLANTNDPLTNIFDGALRNNKKEKDDKGQDFTGDVVQEWTGVLPLTSKPRQKDKNAQIALGAAAGATFAGPAGAAVGGLAASFFETKVRGKIEVKLRYIPIPKADAPRKKYKVKGGLPGVDWGDLYERHVEKLRKQNPTMADPHLGGSDLEFCFFVDHDDTGCACAVYRSLEKKRIAISFRGTCVVKDLVTDASIVQDAWVEGENVDDDDVQKVHSGFRKSLNSISRRLKELILAAVAPGDDFSDYDVIVTGHSLGGALSTIFTADVAEFGMDAGRGLPQLEPSEPWWISFAGDLMSKLGPSMGFLSANPPPPPRPKTLKMYNFGSPRVGNDAFVAKFDSFLGNHIDEAYRVVNGEDAVARFPRTVNAFSLGRIFYEHCGPTALISLVDPKKNKLKKSDPLIWVEGESDDKLCPVRDGTPLTSPLATGSFLGDIFSAVTSSDATISNNKEEEEKTIDFVANLSKVADAMANRFKTFSPSDIPSIVGIDKKFAEREVKIIQSIFSGEALSHHMENQYYLGMGRACGYVALVGEEIKALEEELEDDMMSDALIVDMDEELAKSQQMAQETRA